MNRSSGMHSFNPAQVFPRFVFVSFFVACFTVNLHAQEVKRSAAEINPEYARVANDRANKIVQALGITDEARKVRVQATIANQYCELHEVHAQRDKVIANAKEQNADNKARIQSATLEAQAHAESQQFKLHYAFLGRLSAELSASDVDKVKDAMTYGVAPKTMKFYEELHPALTEEQKLYISALLNEAREFAMDAGSSEEKHAWFGKYKGRVNNYLAAAGFDAKAAEKALQEKRKKDK